MKYHIKLLLKDIVFWVCICGMLFVLNQRMLKACLINLNVLSDTSYYFDAEMSLDMALGRVFPIFCFFLILSYSVFQKMHQEGYFELNYLYTQKKNYGYQLLLLLFVDILITLNALLWIFWFYMKNCAFRWDYAANVIENILVWYFLLLGVAIAIGYVLSLIRNKRVVLCSTVGILLILSPLMAGLASALLYRGVNLYPVLNWIQLMPYPDGPISNWGSYIGILIVKEHYWLMLFWISVCLFVHICSLYPKEKKRRLGLALNTVFCLISIGILAYFPAGIRMDINNTWNGKGHDSYYYNNEKRTIQEKTADFQVDEYQMEFSLTDRLHGEVTLHIAEETKGEQYYFTLYHGYRVTGVFDQQGNKMNFQQYEDYLNVENPGGIESITIIYQGGASGCYTNQKGMLLASYFPYYPRPGYHMVYEGTRDHITYDEFLPILEEQICTYDITVNSSRRVYSNLSEVEQNHFRGEADGVFLLSGFVEEFNYRGIRVLYPYDGREDSREVWMESIDLLLEFEVENRVEEQGKGVRTILTKEIFAGHRNITFGSNWAEMVTLTPDKMLQIEGYDIPDEREFILYYQYYLEHGYNGRNNVWYYLP